MPAVIFATTPIKHGQKVAGNVEISLLPDHPLQGGAPLLIASSPDQEPSIQLLEGSEYRYELKLEDFSNYRWFTDRPEIFKPDTINGRTGRIRTGSYTGWLPVTIFRDGDEAGAIALEVRSRKLNYLNEYQ